MKECRWDKNGWPLPIHDPTIETCQHFTPYTARNSWEWDDAKSSLTKRERGISFGEATEALEKDHHAVRVPVGDPSKWENLEGLDFEKEGIEHTGPNTDPVRDMYIFKHNGKTWVLISTLRGDLALGRKRVISVRRARPKEEQQYDNPVLSGNAGM
ncbi:BrnT family toxin [Chromohalobacter sp. HP20-39]|uniref:BrnT family toxin n=1 Tax=Chromohalobacter sp. HP20-39 TaxID=3079306 RepID=UPI00294B6049|nr:BrnT family toxin [Chromohalobacter sp. HP20-39]MDV6319768.1 BrnT family toxin [Chromohalobacter sp. HP20-39]